MHSECSIHPKYQVKRKPTSMCKTCWAIWNDAEKRRLEREAEEAKVSTMTYTRLPEATLRQLVMDIADNKVFSDRHCRTSEEVLMCFPILQMMELCDRKYIQANPPGLVYEYYSQASPTAVNGLPMFFSCRFLSPEDMAIVHPLVVAEMERRQAFVVGCA